MEGQNLTRQGVSGVLHPLRELGGIGKKPMITTRPKSWRLRSVNKKLKEEAEWGRSP